MDVDPKGYLTTLKIVTQTNTKHPPGWIAAVRLKELAGNIQTARQSIQRGCDAR